MAARPRFFGALPIATGLVVAVALALRLRPGIESFTLAVGLSLLATILLSKQAFMNYYLFVGGAFLIAGLWSTRAECCLPG